MGRSGHHRDQTSFRYGFKVTVTGGLALEDLPLFKGIPIHVFIAGRSIRDAASPVEAARQFKRSIAELWG